MTNGLVLVLDDDGAVRTSVSRILRLAGYDAEPFETARQLVARLPDVREPCCVVSDVRMPGMDGLVLLEELGSRTVPAAVVFLTGFTDIPTTVRAMKRGAIDVLRKPVSSDLLLPAVAAAHARAREEAERRCASEELRRRYWTLTRRERQVFALVTSGLLNKQVGFELGTSEKTVKVQRARVIEKMRATSLAELVRMADRLSIGPAEHEPPAAFGPAFDVQATRAPGVRLVSPLARAS
jgi:FixJ family two-component response regulator